jgi:hypothetical protein
MSIVMGSITVAPPAGQQTQTQRQTQSGTQSRQQPGIAVGSPSSSWEAFFQQLANQPKVRRVSPEEIAL